jgi:hypothetical protein
LINPEKRFFGALWIMRLDPLSRNILPANAIGTLSDMRLNLIWVFECKL